MRHQGGWVKLWRKIDSNPLFDDPLTCALFMRFLIWAVREHVTIDRQGKKIHLKPGQLVTSYRELSRIFGASERSIRRRTTRLQTAALTAAQGDARGVIITICNWNKYQDSEKTGAALTAALTAEKAPHYPPTVWRREKGRRGEVRDTSYLLSSSDSGSFQLNQEEKKTGPTPMDLAKIWNEERANSMPAVKPESLKPKTRRHSMAKSRLADNPDLEYWRGIAKRIAKSAFCRGEKTDWRATFEFFVRKDTHFKVEEGQYDDRSDRNSRESQSKTREQIAREAGLELFN